MKTAVRARRRILLLAFLSVEAALAILVQLSGGDTERALSYCIVVLAFLYSLNFLSGDVARVATVVGLGLTLVADFYLVLLNDCYSIAVSVFLLVQLAYAVRLYAEEQRQSYRRLQLCLRMGISILALIIPFIVLGDGADYLSVICVVYFANLLLNTALACLKFGKNPIFAIGLILFVFCDVFVGFSKLGGYIAIDPGSLAWWLAHPGFNAAWVFYAPSQTLISISFISLRELFRGSGARSG